MLVLTRKHQERIQIGSSITITIVRIQGNAVRVGIEAPRDVRVVRGEVAQRDAETASEFPSAPGTPTAADAEEHGTSNLHLTGCRPLALAAAPLARSVTNLAASVFSTPAV